MVTIIILFLLIVAVNESKRTRRRRRDPIPYNPPPGPPNGLQALQAQRDTIQDRINEIDFTLSFVPPDPQRKRLLNEKIQLFSKLAQVETKIDKLTGQ